MPRERKRQLVGQVAGEVVPSLAVSDGGESAPDRGRVLYVHDIQERLGSDSSGKPRKTSWWVRMHVARDKKFYLGKDAAWYERDFEEWLESQYQQRAG